MPATTLRPLSLGELLDRTFSLYKSNFLLFFGVMVWPSLLAMAMGLANASMQAALQHKGGTSSGVLLMAGAGFIGVMLLFLAYWIAYTVALGATTFAVSDVYLGKAVTIGSSYRKMRGRTWRLMRLFGWIAVQVFGCFLLLIVPITLIPALGGLGAVVLVILFPAAMALLIWVTLRYCVAIPALMLEELQARAAAQRSGQLMKGNFGRAFLIMLLMTIIMYVALIIFQGPFFVGALLMAKGGQPSLWMMGLGSVMGALGGALAAPLIMIGLVLLYYDIRVRKEAFDLQLMMGPPVENIGGDSPATAAAPS